jgi:iron complex outermembrane receptor protein
MMNLKKLPGAIQFALFAGAASLASGAVVAQETETETTAEATTLDRVEVTGSRLKRADIEGASPVIVIDRAQLDASGDVSVADVLRDTTFASFGNFRPQSGSSAQALATIDLRGIGSGRTLVLIDGRRAPSAPFAASSGTDLNAIPLAAVERIEILSDGASAIYGSDAIAGVVNIILRKDFNGVELRYGVANTAVQGGDLEDAAVTFGISGDRGSLLGGASSSSRGMVFTRDQIGARLGVSTFGNNFYNPNTGLIRAVPGFNCNSNGYYLLANGRCSFDFNSVAANEASIKNKSIFTRGEYQINDDWSVYMTANVTRVNSFGRYAPVPGVVIASEGTSQDLFPGDGLPTYYFHRFAAAGNRDSNTDSTNADFLLGFQGQITDSVGVDFGIRRTQYNYNETGRGYILGSLANAAVDRGDYILTDPFGASAETLAGFTVTIGRVSSFETKEVFGSVNFDLFEMGGGISNAIVGAEYIEYDFVDQYDSLSESGTVLGSAGNSSGGSRNVYSAYFEWLFPFSSTFDITLAGRADRYSDYGSDFSPKIAARWQPLDNLTFRASYGQGFRAPGLDILTQKLTFSAEPVNDPISCIAGGAPANCQLQVDTFSIANPSLASEQSDQYSVGVVYDPFEWLDLSLDYYNIQIEDSISSYSATDIINCTRDPAQFGACPAGLGAVLRPATGAIDTITTGFANRGELKTDGLDLRLNTDFDFGTMGRLQNMLNVSYVLGYEVSDITGRLIDQTGLGGAPDMRATLRNEWQMGDFGVGFTTNFIGDHGNYASYATNDVQFTYNTPWNARVSIGATNVGDRYPQLIPYQGRPWNFFLYDAYGRTTYFRYVQSF